MARGRRSLAFGLTPLGFWSVSFLWLIFAGSADSFRPLATPDSNWLELLGSAQMVTLVLLLGLACFVHEGVGNWRPALLPMTRLALVAFLGAHVGSTFGVL